LTEATAAIEASYVGNREAVEAHRDRMFQTLEVDVPSSEPELRALVESSLYLLEILIRIDIPARKQIPGPDLDPERMPAYWTIPQEKPVERGTASQDPAGPIWAIVWGKAVRDSQRITVFALGGALVSALLVIAFLLGRESARISSVSEKVAEDTIPARRSRRAPLSARICRPAVPPQHCSTEQLSQTRGSNLN
jgi:hypothetical protein